MGGGGNNRGLDPMGWGYIAGSDPLRVVWATLRSMFELKYPSDFEFSVKTALGKKCKYKFMCQCPFNSTSLLVDIEQTHSAVVFKKFPINRLKSYDFMLQLYLFWITFMTM
jgi:hypothetical protein